MVSIDLSHLGVIDVLFGIEKVECCLLTKLEFVVDSLGDKAKRLQFNIHRLELRARCFQIAEGIANIETCLAQRIIAPEA